MLSEEDEDLKLQPLHEGALFYEKKSVVVVKVAHGGIDDTSLASALANEIW